MSDFPKLNFPKEVKTQIERRRGKLFIYSEIRQKWLRLTPEEYVRRHMVAFLISQGYPKVLISEEKILKKPQRGAFRTDILVLDKAGCHFLVIECKNFRKKLEPKTFLQAENYNARLDALFLCLTNGLQHFIFKKEKNGYKALDTFPKYPN